MEELQAQLDDVSATPHIIMKLSNTPDQSHSNPKARQRQRSSSPPLRIRQKSKEPAPEFNFAKPKAARLNNKSKSTRAGEDDEAEEAAKLVVPEPSAKAKGKQRAVNGAESDDDETLDSGHTSTKPKGRPPKTKQDSNSGKKRTAAVEKAAPAEEAEETGEVQKKKKRKINIFPTGQPQTFAWQSLASVSDSLKSFQKDW